MSIGDGIAIAGLLLSILGGIGLWIWKGSGQVTLWDQRITRFEEMAIRLEQGVEKQLARIGDEVAHLSEKIDVLGETKARVDVLWSVYERKAP